MSNILVIYVRVCSKKHGARLDKTPEQTYDLSRVHNIPSLSVRFGYTFQLVKQNRICGGLLFWLTETVAIQYAQS